MGILSPTSVYLLAQQSLGAGEGMESKIVPSWPYPPLWLTIVLLVFGLALALFVYLRERGTARLPLRLLLAGIRFSLVALLVLLLYGWMHNRFRTDLPDLVFVIDVTGSQDLIDHYDDPALVAELARRASDAGFDKPSRLNLGLTLLLEDDAALLQDLAQRYNVKVYTIGTAAQAESSQADDLPQALRGLRAEQPASRLGDGLLDVLEAQRGRPTAAIVVLSDGITTQGKSLSDAARYAQRKEIPLMTIGLGNDQPARDLRLSDLVADEVVFVHDTLHVQARLTASGYARRSVTVRLKDEASGAILTERPFTISGDGQTQAIDLSYRPGEKGDYRYVLEVEPLEGEIHSENNRQTALVSVRDETIRVLLVQGYPSWEFRSLKTMLGRQRQGEAAGTAKAVQLDTVLQEADLEYADIDETAKRGFPVRRDELFQYDVILFGDVNPALLTRPVMENVAEFVTSRGGGVVFLSGPRYTPRSYVDTPLAALLPIDLATCTAPNPDAVLSDAWVPQPTRLGLTAPQLQLADAPLDSMRVWQSLPGLYWMIDAPDAKPGAMVLLEHPTRTGNAGFNLPVVCMQYVGSGKVVMHLTDETWRWSKRTDEDYFARYWMQTIRYLSRSKLLGTSRMAEVSSDREQYDQGEPVLLRVRFFDDRQAPAEDDGVTVVLEREGGARRHVKLHRDRAQRGIFDATVSNLAEGNYRAWLAVPTLEGRPPSHRLAVVAPAAERAKMEMDSADLQRAAEVSGGHFYTVTTADELVRDLPKGRQVRIETLPSEPAWNWWPFPLAFVLLIVTEWLLRKRYGML